MPTPTETLEQPETKKVARTDEEKETEVFRKEALKTEAAAKKTAKTAKTEAKAEADVKVKAQKRQTVKDLRIARGPKTSAEVLEGLAKTGTPKVRITVAKHDNTSDETLAMLAAEEDQPGVVDEALKSIAKREKAAQKVIDKAETVKVTAEKLRVKNEGILETTENKVAEFKAKDKLTKAQMTSLIRNENKVKELKKILGIKPEPKVKVKPEVKAKKKTTKKGKRATSKRSLSRRGPYLNPPPF